MNTRDLIKLARKADLEGDTELADYLDNRLVRVAILRKIWPGMAKGWDYSRRPNYDVDFTHLAPDASNLDTMTRHPTQTGGRLRNFFQAGKKTVTRTPERLVEIEKQIKSAILNISSTDPKIDAAIKKVQAGQALTPDERNSLLNILVRDNKVATRANDIAVQDITAVLEGKKPSLPTKEVTTLSGAGKTLAVGSGALTALNLAGAGINAYNQNQQKPGDLYNQQPGVPSMPSMPQQGGGGQGGGGGGYHGGGGYQGPYYNESRRDNNAEPRKYQPAYLDDQLYGPRNYRVEPEYDDYYPDDYGADNQEFTQGTSRYQSIGPEQEAPRVNNSVDQLVPPGSEEGTTTDLTANGQFNTYRPEPAYPPVPDYLTNESL